MEEALDDERRWTRFGIPIGNKSEQVLSRVTR